MKVRTAWQVTKDVWYALLLRELLTRLTSTRYAWFWLLAEPVLIILFMLSLKLMARTGDTIAGSDGVVWMILGLVAFHTIRDIAFRGMDSIQANRSLLTFRQVKPLDSVIVRSFVESFLHFGVLVVLLTMFGLAGQDVVPNNGLYSGLVFINLCVFGLGLGLCFSILAELLGQPFKATVRLMSMPLLLISGVILPLHSLPEAVLEYLMYNPIVHGLEYFRYVFFERYHMVPGVSMSYFNYFTLTTLFVGMILYMRFKHRITAS